MGREREKKEERGGIDMVRFWEVEEEVIVFIYLLSFPRPPLFLSFFFPPLSLYFPSFSPLPVSPGGRGGLVLLVVAVRL